VNASYRDLLRHALGVQLKAGKWTRPYRNHFVAAEDDQPAWDAIVALGYAKRWENNELWGACPVYRVTPAGELIALAGIELADERPMLEAEQNIVSLAMIVDPERPFSWLLGLAIGGMEAQGLTQEEILAIVKAAFEAVDVERSVAAARALRRIGLTF